MAENSGRAGGIGEAEVESGSSIPEVADACGEDQASREPSFGDGSSRLLRIRKARASVRRDVSNH